MLFDERTYLEMEKAMKAVIKASDDRLTELKQMFYGALEPTFAPLREIHHDLLNDAQKRAVQSILAAKDIAIVHGPPGTGKTTTLVHAIKLLAETEKNMLVTASSNAAVDLLVERLAEQGLNVVRIGNISRINEQLVSMTLDGRLAEHPEHKNIKRLRVQAASARKGARRFKRRFGTKERSKRNENYQEARELESYAKMLEERLLHEILFQADVIACTLVNTQSKSLEHLQFKTVIIDEAAQALEPATWIPLARGYKVILAGDPFQLPPVIKSKEAREKGLGMTLLEKWVKDGKTTSFLDTQYRMHPTIMNFSNAIFYENDLKAAPDVIDRVLGIPDLSSVLFIDTAGCGFNEEVNPETKSRFNEGEAFILREYFLKLTNQLSIHNIDLPTMAIITPYREQARHLSQMFQEDSELLTFSEHLSINSVDAFQGQERDVVFISLTRSNDKTEIGFLSDYRRMNVALTRAKKHLVVIGDSATIGVDDFYQKFIEYAETHGQYQSAWEYMKQ
jgi:Superfamily I DNA and RNA helicases and helicase subunits